MRVFNENYKKKAKMSSTQIIVLGFLLAIFIGAGLLMLPFATARGQHTGLSTALFTATTSICVTGLVVVDTFSHWTDHSTGPDPDWRFWCYHPVLRICDPYEKKIFA